MTAPLVVGVRDWDGSCPSGRLMMVGICVDEDGDGGYVCGRGWWSSFSLMSEWRL